VGTLVALLESMSVRVFIGILAAFAFACAPVAHSLQRAAVGEVYSTASCANLDVSHVPTDDVSTRRDDVYVAEGCGMRWRMTCGSKYVSVCPRRHSSTRQCRTELQWSCDNIQSEDDPSDDELRARISRPSDVNVLGS
jgi:hypothetical protein